MSSRIRWPLIVMILAMVAVSVADGLWLASLASPDAAAISNGIAAVVCAVAALVEARNGRADRHQIADHEARLRVLEDRGSRS
jgi:putative Ca2+/H+ antiporter (TMEM165/GDT1 family)